MLLVTDIQTATVNVLCFTLGKLQDFLYKVVKHVVSVLHPPQTQRKKGLGFIYLCWVKTNMLQRTKSERIIVFICYCTVVPIRTWLIVNM